MKKQEILDYVFEDKISCIAECNPLHGPRVRAMIESLEEGKMPDKFSYVDEQIFSAHDTIKEIVVDGVSYPVTIFQ